MSVLWWCEEHQSPTGDRHIDGVSRCFLALDEGLVFRNCRFVQQVRVAVGGIDVAELAFVIGQHVELDDAAVTANPMMLHEAARAVLAAIDQEDT